ncbi:Protein of unknown function [Gryllus bimaculatus]|nr:Protein of unknown function [Gryllus bimaculatus]
MHKYQGLLVVIEHLFSKIDTNQIDFTPMQPVSGLIADFQLKIIIVASNVFKHLGKRTYSESTFDIGSDYVETTNNGSAGITNMVFVSKF